MFLTFFVIMYVIMSSVATSGVHGPRIRFLHSLINPVWQAYILLLLPVATVSMNNWGYQVLVEEQRLTFVLLPR
jgi:hypothetical protein